MAVRSGRTQRRNGKPRFKLQEATGVLDDIEADQASVCAARFTFKLRVIHRLSTGQAIDIVRGA